MKAAIIAGVLLLAGCVASPPKSLTSEPTIHIASNGVVFITRQLDVPTDAGEALQELGVPKNCRIRVEAEPGTLHKYIKAVFTDIESSGYTNSRFHQVNEKSP